MSLTPGEYYIVVYADAPGNGVVKESREDNIGSSTPNKLVVRSKLQIPLTNLPGKDVPEKSPDFFENVLDLLNIPVREFATKALIIWTRYENTGAYWNPLATKWDMREKSSDFNFARVKNYIDKDTGIRATANTLSLSYYEAIRNMFAKQSFDRQLIRQAVGTWSGLNHENAYVTNLVQEWEKLSQAPSPLTTAPNPPVLSLAGAGNGYVDLSWTTPSSGGSPITGYKVYRGTTPGGETYLATTTPDWTTFHNTTVVNGTTYYYKVTAVNAVGESAPSNEISGKPTAPGTITVGSSVSATANVNSRTIPTTSGSSIIRTIPGGSSGVVTGGPVSANGYVWWEIRWSDGTTGWSVQDYIMKI